MTNNMTEGKVMKLLVYFTIPIFIGNIFQQFYNIIDAIIVGQFVGVQALASIKAVTSIMFLVIGWVNGITSGFAILIAQSFGAGDEKRLKNYEGIAICLCVVMTIVMTVVLLILNDSLLYLLKVPKEIFADASAYMAIIYVGLGFTVAYNILGVLLRALGDSKTPLYFLIFSSVLNVVFDLLFVVVFHWGVKGAGYATVIAQGISAVLCFVYINKKHPILKLKMKEVELSWRGAKHLLGMGIPMGLQFSITAVGAMVVQAALNPFGKIYISAFGTAGSIQGIVLQLFIALGTAVAMFVSQNRGAGRIDRIRECVRKVLIFSLVMSTVCAVGIYFYGGMFVRWFVSDPTGEITKIAMEYFKVVIWFYPALSVIFLYRNALQGLGDGVIPMIGGIFELIARGGAIFFLAAPFGYLGICAADPIAWILVLIPLVPIYYLKVKKLSENIGLEQSLTL